MAVALAGIAAGSAARADVLEIDDSGAVHVRSGGGEVQWLDPAAASQDDADVPSVPDAAITQLATPLAPESLRAALTNAATHYGISPELLAALVRQESGWRATALSAKGAIGLAQLMPATARALAVDARDPASNLDGGAHYLRTLLDMFDGDLERALAAYNAGPGRVIRAGGLPRIAETRAYVTTIIDRLTPDLATEYGKR